jgi:hypothetical protein
MIYEDMIENRKVKTGDIISTKDGNNSIYALGFKVLGELIPGTVDHTVMYIGPNGLCVESGLAGVIAFNVGTKWDSEDMFAKRGLIDTFYAASSVLAGKGLSTEKEEDIRNFVRGYVLGSVGKPYNFDFFHPDYEKAVYCSQLVYLAYKKMGVNLHVGAPAVPAVIGGLAAEIVFPQELLDGTTLIKPSA